MYLSILNIVIHERHNPSNLFTREKKSTKVTTLLSIWWSEGILNCANIIRQWFIFTSTTFTDIIHLHQWVVDTCLSHMKAISFCWKLLSVTQMTKIGVELGDKRKYLLGSTVLSFLIKERCLLTKRGDSWISKFGNMANKTLL